MLFKPRWNLWKLFNFVTSWNPIRTFSITHLDFMWWDLTCFRLIDYGYQPPIFPQIRPTIYPSFLAGTCSSQSTANFWKKMMLTVHPIDWPKNILYLLEEVTQQGGPVFLFVGGGRFPLWCSKRKQQHINLKPQVLTVLSRLQGQLFNTTKVFQHKPGCWPKLFVDKYSIGWKK